MVVVGTISLGKGGKEQRVKAQYLRYMSGYEIHLFLIGKG
jgi:hypothetical protein